VIPIVNAETMGAIDRETIEKIGIPGPVLMENAGSQTARVIMDILEEEHQGGETLTVGVVAGRGNNGGDGFVIARYLMEEGFETKVFIVGRGRAISEDARLNLDIYKKCGGEVINVKDRSSFEEFRRFILEECQVIVDALFGTGLSKEVKGRERDAIETINLSSSIVVSVDMPSGINADNGRVLGEAVWADYTATFGFMKIGQVLLPGLEHCGVLQVVDIGIPWEAYSNVMFDTYLIDGDEVGSMFPLREYDHHKGDSGKVCIIGGSIGMTGAVAMAAEGALVSGAGLIYTLVPGKLAPTLEGKLTEQITVPIQDGGKGILTCDGEKEVLEFIEGMDGVAIGPGMARSDETGNLFNRLIPGISSSMVIDADGLFWLSKVPGLLKGRKASVVITPHEMEMARLMDLTLDEVRSDRLGSARDCARKYGAVTVLKGYRTVVAEPGGAVYINPTGNPYMATGGMGDVLTGMILSFLGQGLEPFEGAALSVYFHGLTGDIVLERYPESPIAPRHIIAYYPEAVKSVLSDGEEESGLS